MEQNLNQYRIFYTVAKHGNISHAAQALYISQPAISKAIAKLEDDLGTALFVRSSRGVTLTPQGEILYEHLHTAFDAIALGEDKLRRSKALGIGHLTIGASATLCKYMLLPFLQGFVAKYPHISITIESQSTSHTLRLLEEGKIDIALVVHPEAEGAIHFDPVSDIHDIFVATSTYLDNLRLRQSGEQAFAPDMDTPSFQGTKALFQSANMMMLDDRNVSRQHIDAYFKTQGIAPEQILVANSMDLLINFARIGLGIACVIEEFVEEDLRKGHVVKIPLAHPVKKRTAGFAFLKNAVPTEPLQNFITFYREQLQASE